MANLFTYTTSALMAATDDNYIRLEIQVSVPKEFQQEKVFCERIKVWLPVGETEKGISLNNPMPFTSDPRWAASNSNVVNEKEVNGTGDPNQSMVTYYFDDESKGKIPLNNEPFTIGFRIENARIKALKNLVIQLEEMSGKAQENLTPKSIKLSPSLELIRPSIHYFVATKKDSNVPATEFSKNDPITLKWAGSLVKSYELYINNVKIDKGENLSHDLSKLSQSTAILLKGNGALGTEHLETYQSLSIVIADAELEKPVVVGNMTLRNPHQQSDVKTWNQDILFADELTRCGAKISAIREKWELAPMKLSFFTGALNEVNERVTIKSDGNVVIGNVNTALPALPHPKLLITNGYQAHSEVSTVIALDTGNTAQGFLWGNSPEGPYDGIHLSFNYYRHAKVDIIPNKEYGTTQVTSNNQGYISFNTGAKGQAPTEKMRIDVNGRVGIGTSTPTQTLDVNGGAVIKGSTVVNGNAEINGAITSHQLNVTQGKAGIGTSSIHTNFRMQVKGGEGVWKGGVAAGGDNAAVTLGEVNNVATIGGHSGTLDAWQNLAINPGDGNVGIGTFSPGKKLHVVGDSLFDGKVWVTKYKHGAPEQADGVRQLVYWQSGNGGWFTDGPQHSDDRLKCAVQPITNALHKLTSLQGVSYQWNERGLTLKTEGVEKNYSASSGKAEDNQQIWDAEKRRIRQENAGVYKGFIAQQVETVFPEWVKEDEKGYKTLNTSEMLPLLVEAIKEQQKQIEILQQKLAMLEKKSG